MRRKTIFIIPGYRHKTTNKAYKEIAKILKKEGHSPILIKIPWRKTTISENTEYFLKKYRKTNTRKNYVLGFSFGAMIAFLASTKVNVSGLILCSLSPYFQEDLPKMKRRLLSPLVTKRYQDFTGLHCATLARKIRAKQIHLLYGTKEDKSLKKRIFDTYRQIPSAQKYLVSVKKTEHDLASRRYLDKIYQVVLELN